MEKPLLEFKIHNLIIRITSEKPTKRPLSSLKFCSHCRSSQKYPLPAADTCFMDPEMELHQQSWSKKTSSRSSWSLLFVLSFGAAVHRLAGAPAKTVAKAFQYYQGWLKKAVLQQDVKYILKRDPLSAACGKYICQRQCYSHANMGLGSQEHLPEPYGCIGHRCRYTCRYIKLASAFFLSISICASWAHCFFFMYLFRLFGILSVVHSPGSFSLLVRIQQNFLIVLFFCPCYSSLWD